MRVAEGYRPKVKFSVTFTPDILEQLDEYCRTTGVHRTRFIEEAVRRALAEGGTVRSMAEPLRTSRDAKHMRKKVFKAEALRNSVRKPHRRRP